MFTLMLLIFVLGYVCIALEHVVFVNKSATALLLGCIMWVCVAASLPSNTFVYTQFMEHQALQPDSTFLLWLTQLYLPKHLGETAEILFFLIGAMTIVELIDSHRGFSFITNRIATTKKTLLIWIICVCSFFLSAVLDNMTTTIVMVALIRKLIGDQKDKWLFAGMVVVAANAGGAWSPIGDVTTIMLWLAGKVTSISIMSSTFVASFVSMLVPLIILSFRLKGVVCRPEMQAAIYPTSIPVWQSKLILLAGVGLMLFVPVFKSLTHLPPYLGMLGGLGILWVLTDVMHRKNHDRKEYHSVIAMIKKIDTPCVLFFLGILMAVEALQAFGHLNLLSNTLDAIPLDEPEKYYAITSVIGVLSSIIDNVPLVAGAMGMYDFPQNHYFWEFLAYTAGTGGSILIIGSAAGVAAMGMERINFIWYLKKISLLAFAGYISGAAVYILQHTVGG
ncbi:MAG: sodium:proton antiporter NhaD [Prevotellaceae bacterium]|jgi:Na+/H+ antiporter NhaD/arsenite permease-like protein|nr:sodium:proton antiporter NhaD [Prevotellaceae bacterium]